MRPGENSSPQDAPTALPNGQKVYITTSSSQSVILVWTHNVSIEIGIGPDPKVERTILDSITYRPDTPSSPVAGRCPPPDPTPPSMPTASRVTTPTSLPGHDGTVEPEPAGVQPKVSPATVWTALFHNFGEGGFAGPLQWSISFGSYSAQTPATINPSGSATPNYQGVPTWVIQGVGVATRYGPCGITVIAPYNANTGDPMGVETLG